MQQADHPAPGLTLDSPHTLSLDDALDGLSNMLADKLFFVQFMGAPRLSTDAPSQSRYHHNPLGQGDLPVTDFACDLLAVGYTGPLSLEVFNDDSRLVPVRFMAPDGMCSLL